MILKNGDDIRRDMAVMEMFRMMNGLWKANGHKAFVKTYGCIAISEFLGRLKLAHHMLLARQLRVGWCGE